MQDRDKPNWQDIQEAHRHQPLNLWLCHTSLDNGSTFWHIRFGARFAQTIKAVSCTIKTRERKDRIFLDNPSFANCICTYQPDCNPLLDSFHASLLVGMEKRLIEVRFVTHFFTFQNPFIMAIDTKTGWTRAKDPVEIATKSQKIKLTGLTLDEGDLQQLQDNTTLETLELLGCDFSYAAGKPDFNDLPGIQAAATLESIDLTGSTGMVGAPSEDWEACEKLADVSINDCGYNTAALDAFLIAFNAARAASPGLGSGTTPGVLNIAGASNGIRTAKSNAAVTALTGAGWTVTQNT